MSRHHPHDISAILSAAETWQTDCLIGDGSVFGVGETWTPANIDALFNAFTPQVDEGDQAFLEKLQEQLKGSGPVALLCAEILWVMYLFPVASHTKPERKRTIITTVASWSGTRIETSHKLLDAPLKVGIGNPGSAYHTRRWTELSYFIKVLRDIKHKPGSERRNLLAFPWAFGRYLDDLAGESKPLLSHMLRYLLFPERYEPIFTRSDKRRIVAAFRQTAAKVTQAWSTTQLDRELLKIRKEQVATHGSQALSFFQDPLLAKRKGLEKTLASKRATAAAAQADIVPAEQPKIQPANASAPIKPAPEPPTQAPPAADASLVIETAVEFHDSAEYNEVIDADAVLGESDAGEIIHHSTPTSDDSTSAIEQEDTPAAAPEPTAAPEPEPEPEPDDAHETENHHPLNQLFCGAPGTGKTYLAIQRAVEICDGQAPADRAELMTRYRALESAQRIRFIAFHESFGYEDFVEGIRPDLNNADGEDGVAQLSHVCKPGILKQMAGAARHVSKASSRTFRFDRTHTTWKMSLGIASDERKVFGDAIKGGFVTLGYGEGVDLSHCASREDVYQRMVAAQPDLTIADYSVSAMHYFSANMQTNDLVVISDGNTKFRAIGRITGDYRHVDTQLSYDYQQLRSVEWLATYDPGLPFEKISTKQFSQRALYKLDSSILRVEAMERLTSNQPAEKPENYVLIIDEINRGNIPKVFGELITLIEEDKREGAENALSAVLPLSNESFSIPPTLYLIGTMSSALGKRAYTMDPALQRRFEFQELHPDATLICGADGQGNISDDNGAPINLRELLDTLNRRLQDGNLREGLIGHSYFMQVKNAKQLERVIKRQVLPSLQTHFHGDSVEVGRIIKELLAGALDGNATQPQWGSTQPAVDANSAGPRGPIIQ